MPSSLTADLFTTMTASDKYVYYQRHTTAINFDTFTINHSQAANPVDYTTVLTWNYLFMYNIDNATPYAGSLVLYFMMETEYQNGWSTDPADACVKMNSTPPF